jgi:hypothetical protein
MTYMHNEGYHRLDPLPIETNDWWQPYCGPRLRVHMAPGALVQQNTARP